MHNSCICDVWPNKKCQFWVIRHALSNQLEHWHALEARSSDMAAYILLLNGVCVCFPDFSGRNEIRVFFSCTRAMFSLSRTSALCFIYTLTNTNRLSESESVLFCSWYVHIFHIFNQPPARTWARNRSTGTRWSRMKWRVCYFVSEIKTYSELQWHLQ